MNVPLPEGFDVAPIVADLSKVHGIIAVVLGGSWASGRQRPDSDVDLGLVYRAPHPLDVNAVREIARLYNDTPNPEVLALAGDLYTDRAWTRAAE